MKKEEVLKVINSLIERFDYLEEESGTDFSIPKKIILRWYAKNLDEGLIE